MKAIYPLKFLESYNENDQDYFFGRKEETEILYRMVFQSDLTLVYGESGTGKSSLVHCGLASKFHDYEWLPLHIFRGANIIDSLLSALKKQVPLNEIDDTPKEQHIENEILQIIKVVHKQLFRPLYLIFDQLEELFILGKKSEQEEFSHLIKHILENNTNNKIILIIREEYLGKLSEFEKIIPNILKKRLRVERMDKEKVAKVIDGINNLENSLIKFEKIDNKPDTSASHLKRENIISITASVITNRIFNVINKENGQLFIELPYLQVYLDYIYYSKTNDDDHKTEVTLKVNDFESKTDFEDILKLFLDNQINKIGTSLKLESKLVWDSLKFLVSFEGTKAPILRNVLFKKIQNLKDKSLNPEQINSLISCLDKFRIIKINEQTKLIELHHDSLAKLISAKRTPQEIQLLEVEKMIKNVIDTTIGGKKEYFSNEQLNSIKNCRGLTLTPVQTKWISTSKNFRRIQFYKPFILAGSIIGIIIILAAIISYYIIKDRSEEFNNKSEEYKIKSEEYEKRLKEYEDVLTLTKDNSILNQDSKGNLAAYKEADSIQKVFKYQLDLLLERQKNDSIIINDLKGIISEIEKSESKENNLEIINNKVASVNKKIEENIDIPVIIPITEDTKWFKEGFFLLYGNIKVSLNELNAKENKATFLICEIYEANTLCINTGIPIEDLVAGKSKSISLGGINYKLTLIKIDNAGKNPLTKAAYITFTKVDS